MKKNADKLAETLAADRQEQEEREDRLSTETADALDEEISEYEAYVAEDGKRPPMRCAILIHGRQKRSGGWKS